VAVGFGIFTKLLPMLVDGQQVNPQVDQRGRLIVSSGDDSVIYTTAVDLDTDGGIVPTYRGFTNTYDPSGNLLTQTVRNGGTWVRTLTYLNGEVASDSGWVKQNG